jgi:LytS/YehU family sensor histidine kinase
VINSIVALSRLNPVAVEPTLIQLSQLLRYMLYITDEEKVTLRQKEEYLRSYIELQRLRFHNQVTINFTSEIESGEKTIEPMLLIPFLENAFKYGTGDMAHPGIVIYLKTKNNLLDFYVQNAYNPKDKNKEESHGIGINNVKRRLELLYPGKHSLLIDQSEHFFKVKLQIKLK